MNVQRPLTGAERAKRWRAAMRAKGLRPKTFWLPDTSTPKYKAWARGQSEALDRWYAANPEVLAELDDMQAWPEDEEA